MRTATERQNTLKKVSAIVATLSFTADLLTLALFLRDLVLSDLTVDLSSITARVIIIISAFAFSALLIAYSRTGDWKSFTSVTATFFSWLYVLFSALLLAIVSYRFILESDYEIGTYFGNVVLSAFIAGLAFIVMLIAGKSSAYFSLPFMLVSLEQIVLWIIRIFNRLPVRFDWTFIGNIGLFVYSGILIVVFMKYGEELAEKRR